MDATTRYIRPGRFDVIFNGLVGKLTRAGVSVMGSRELAVRGRASGEWRKVPVNLLTVDGERYLVAPRGQAQWVRNIRIAGGGELRVGRRVEVFTVEEVADGAKAPILRAYLKRWGWEVGRFFENVDASSSDERLAEIAPGFPVFRVK
ncbi:nitroreductase/quinone reductase family protein [Pseudonocardia sp. GCM10023141]|uniref:nitroreductase/quinone reductase family protein n=1 Tax=Pseudonocardia sp. GCM10023141 TaxID=3252653 RepID=UPI003613906A